LTNDDYLTKLGIQTWHLRYFLKNPLYYYGLTKEEQHIGYLILEYAPQGVQHPKLLQLITSILYAIHLKLQIDCVDSVERLVNDDNQAPKDASLIITMGNTAAYFEAHYLEHIPYRYTLPDPMELLTSPLRKKEVWLKLCDLGEKNNGFS
jgi:hypothetical protein